MGGACINRVDFSLIFRQFSRNMYKFSEKGGLKPKFPYTSANLQNKMSLKDKQSQRIHYMK